MQANLFQKRVARTYAGAAEAAPGWHAWYWPAREGVTRPGDDRPGPCSDDGRSLPGGIRRPGGTLVWGRRGDNPEELLTRLGRGHETVRGPATALTRHEMRGVFGPGWVTDEARRADDETITGPVRKHVLDRLAEFIASARATDPTRQWTAPWRTTEPLETIYTQESGTLLIDAAAPHHPGQWPRKACIKLQRDEAPEITITALGSGQPEVKVAGTRFNAPLADLADAVAVAVDDRTGLRPRALRTDTLGNAGRVLTARSPAVILTSRGPEGLTRRHTNREWLIETLQRYAIPRQDGTSGDSASEGGWELDVRRGETPAILQSRNGSLVLTTAGHEKTLARHEAARIGNVADALRTMWGAEGFWTDIRTEAVETLERPAADPGTRRRGGSR